MSSIYKAKLTLGCQYYSDRADALTDDAFKRFFADNPAYQVKQYLLIDNDNLRQKRKARKPLNRIATSHHNRVCQVWQTLLFCLKKPLYISYSCIDCRKLSQICCKMLTSLGSQSFSYMDNLKTVSVDEKLSSKDYDAFAGYATDLKYVSLKTNPFKASDKKVTVKAKKIKTKAKTLGAGSVYKVTPSETVLYAEKVSGNKKITVNKLNGNITVAKKTKKGTYKIKVKIMSTGNATYKASDWKTVTVTVKVK